MFKSFCFEQLSQYYSLRSQVLSDSALKHELCYLRRFDEYLYERAISSGQISEYLMNSWVGTLKGKSKSIGNEVIVIRRFLYYLRLTGERVFIPVIPKIGDDYVPYIFSDEELDKVYAVFIRKRSIGHFLDVFGKGVPIVHKAEPTLIVQIAFCFHTAKAYAFHVLPLHENRLPKWNTGCNTFLIYDNVRKNKL